MDDIVARPRYPRHTAPGRRRRRVSGEKLRLPQLIARQAAVALAILLILGVVKNVDTPATNFVTKNVRYVLEQNIELSTVSKFLDNTFASLKNFIAPDSRNQAQNGISSPNVSGAADGKGVQSTNGSANMANLSDSGNTTSTGNAASTGNTASTANAESASNSASTGNTSNTGNSGNTGSKAADGNYTDQSGLSGTDETPATNKASSDDSIADKNSDADSINSDAAEISDNIDSADSTVLPETSVLSASTDSEAGETAAGGLIVPVKGTLSSLFGERIDPATGVLKMHEGIDIDVVKGGGVAAAFDGTVTEAGSSPSYGNYIRLRHAGGLETVYAHCSKLYAAAGDTVKQGSIIAEVGDSGAAVGMHLHFEVWKDGKPVDPLNYIDIALK